MRLITSSCQSGFKAEKLFLLLLWAGLAGAGLVAALCLTGWSRPAAAQAIPDRSNALRFQRSQTFLFVDPAIGADNGSGSQQSPFRTIQHALQVAQPHTVILLAPGLYSADSGEIFPLQMRSHITIQGDPGTAGQGIVLRGGAQFVSPSQGSQNVTLIGATNALLMGVTVTNPQGHGVWIESSNPTIAHNTFADSQQSGVTVTGNALAAIQQNRFRQNRSTGLTISGTAQPEVRQNRFEQTEVGITIAESASPLIVQNQISRNRTGILVQDNARPVLRRNTIEYSREAGLIARNVSQPDLGTAADAGQNQFRENRQDVNATGTTQTVPIAGNQLTAQQVSGKVDFTGAIDPAPVPQTTAQRPDPTLARSASTEPDQPQPEETIAAARPAEPIAPTPLIHQLPPQRTASNRSPSPSLPIPPAPPLPPLPPSPHPSTLSIPIPVPPPENAGILVSSARPVSIPVPPPNPAIAAPSSDSPLNSPLNSTMMAAVPVSVPFRVPQPLAATEMTAPIANSFAAVPVMQSSLALPALPPVPHLSAPVTPAESEVLLALQSNVLPVPDGDAPIGNTGDMPRINVPAGQRGSGGGAGYSPEQLRSMLRYRVVVEATSERIQAMVRSLVPSAFVVSERGRPLIQVGAFSDRDNAEDAVRLLNQNGLRAVVQRLQ